MPAAAVALPLVAAAASTSEAPGCSPVGTAEPRMHLLGMTVL